MGHDMDFEKEYEYMRNRHLKNFVVEGKIGKDSEWGKVFVVEYSYNGFQFYNLTIHNKKEYEEFLNALKNFDPEQLEY